MKKIIITEGQYKRLNENIVVDVASDIGGDAVRDLLSAIPGVGDLGVALPSIIKNLKEIKDGSESLTNLLSNGSPTEEEVRDLQTDIITDILDLFQSILGAFPDPGLTEIIAFLTSIKFNALRVIGGDEFISYISSLLSKKDGIINTIGDSISPISQLIPKEINPIVIVTDGFDALAEGEEYIKNLKERTPLDQKLSKKLNKLPQNIMGELGMGDIN